MNAGNFDPVAEDAAALWAAKIDGASLSADDRNALTAWLARDPTHRVLLTQYCQFSTDLEQWLPQVVLAGGVTLPEAAPAPKPNRARLYWLAGTLAAAAAVVVGIRTTLPTHTSETYATSVAERRTLKLSDGSIVELNARTSLLVELSSKQRHVRMADGEAFFTVAKDKSRPFIVETPAGAVRVTGTVFAVQAENASNLAVTVVEGSVQVTPCATASQSTQPVGLRAHDQLIASGAATCSLQRLSDGELDDALAWRRGEAVFEGVPLGKALARFSRYHGRAISVSADAARLTVGGRYNLDNLEGFLTDIQSLLPVHVTVDQSSGAITVATRSGN
jgi:transmembrane sensor